MNAGVVSDAQLNDALEVHKATGSPLGRVLVELGYASQGAILSVMAQQIGIPYIDFSERRPDATAIAVVPKDLAVRYTLMPVAFDDQDRLIVAMADPQNVLALDDLRIVTGYEIRPAISTKDDIVATIEDAYKTAEHVDTDSLFGDELSSEDLSSSVRGDVRRADRQTRELHHHEGRRRSRFRHPPRAAGAGPAHPVPRRRRSARGDAKPQGRAGRDDLPLQDHGGHGHSGESQAAGRALRTDSQPVTSWTSASRRCPPCTASASSCASCARTRSCCGSSDLGFLPTSLDRFESSFRKPYGAILVTGPTGSGKSTSLYAAINVLNEPHRHIITAEDPVEYRLPGVNQIQTNAKAGLTFAGALRSFLRCSPDVILVGEIRDHETARIAIESALTGHLVLSTLHTNDAAGAVTRLVEMGVEPFLVSSAVDCVLGQRLARRLCKECKEEFKPPKQMLVDAGYPKDKMPETLWRPKGCKKCGNTGYRGRMGVHEVLLMSEEISKLTVGGATSEDIKRVAIRQGMLTLREDGLEKARMGQTSVEEISRVVV